MTFRETTLAGYARAAVDLKAQMYGYCHSSHAAHYLDAWTEARRADGHAGQPAGAHDAWLFRDLARFLGTIWQSGEPYVLAPAMTAVVAAAAQALDLTGDVLTADIAPCETGVLFLPEPIYQRDPTGRIHSVGAITWRRIANPTSQPASRWLITAWADRDDPHDPQAAAIRADAGDDPALLARLGRYVLVDLDAVPIDAPVNWTATTPVPDADQDWETAPDGRYVIDAATAHSRVCVAIAYAFWRIQAQPIAVAAPAPLDRAARRRAVRASVVHTTRVVMLRRTSPVADRRDGEAKWHYRVRFIVRGHWRRLIDRDGHPYRIWINAHIKGPDGAPLLHGEKVAVLAR